MPLKPATKPEVKKNFFKNAKFSRQHILIFSLVFGVIGGLLIYRSFAAGSNPDGTWENGMGTFSNLECPHPDTQFARVTNPVRTGKYAAKFHETAADVWPGNNIVRCLAADYNTGENTGDEYYYSLSVYIPSPGLSNNLIWELHHRAELYNNQNCGVAPFALNSRDGGMTFRISTGNCTVGSGYQIWEPQIPIPNLASQPLNTWIDFVFHIKFTESNSGIVEVYDRIGNGAWSRQISRSGIPTMPYCDSCGVHNLSLYTEMGLYVGSSYNDSDTVYLDNYLRHASLAAAQAVADGGAVTPSPTPSPSPTPTPPPAANSPTITQNITAGQTLSGTINWTAATTATNIAKVEFAIDGNTNNTTDTSAPFSRTLDTTTLSNGSHNLGLTVTLSDGTVLWQPYQIGDVTVNNSTSTTTPPPTSTPTPTPPPTTTPPPPSSTTPTITQNISSGQTLSGTIKWTASTTATNIASVSFDMDYNKALSTVDTTAPFSRSLDTTKYANGSHVLGLSITLNDGTVLWQPYQIGSVTFSNTTPTPSPAPTPPPPPTSDTQAPSAPGNFRVSATGKNNVSLAWNASTDNVAVTSYKLYRNNNSTPIYTGPALSLNNYDLGAKTSYSYYVTATDKAGNTSPPSAKVCVAKWSWWSNFSRSRSWKYC